MKTSQWFDDAIGTSAYSGSQADETITYDEIEKSLNLLRGMASPRIRFIENSSLTIAGPLQDVPRTWRERLLTRPWRPWISIKHVQTYLPDPSMYQLPDGLIVAHPATLARLRLASTHAKSVDAMRTDGEVPK